MINPADLTPASLQPSITLGYDTTADHYTVLLGEPVNVGPLPSIELNASVATDFLATHAPKDAIPGTVHLSLQEGLRRPTIEPEQRYNNYLHDYRLAGEPDQPSPKEAITDTINVITPVNIARTPLFKGVQHREGITQKIAASLLFGAKLRSPEELLAATERADSHRKRARIANGIVGALATPAITYGNIDLYNALGGDSTCVRAVGGAVVFAAIGSHFRDWDSRVAPNWFLPKIMITHVERDLYQRSLAEVKAIDPAAIAPIAAINYQAA